MKVLAAAALEHENAIPGDEKAGRADRATEATANDY